MNKLIAILFSFMLIAPVAKANVSYMDVYPVFIRHCAGCHNASSAVPNWLDPTVATNNKGLIFQRVFVDGDMPLYFRFFGGEDKRILKMWLEQTEVK